MGVVVNPPTPMARSCRARGATAPLGNRAPCAVFSILFIAGTSSVFNRAPYGPPLSDVKVINEWWVWEGCESIPPQRPDCG